MTLIVRSNNLYHVRLNGVTHWGKSYEEAKCILQYAGIDPYQALASAIILRDPYDIQYEPIGRHKWWIDGKPVPVNVVRLILADVGCGKRTINAILQALKFCKEAADTAKMIREAGKEIDEEWREWVLSKKSGSATNARIATE